MQKTFTAAVIFVFGVFINATFAQDGVEIMESNYSVKKTTDRLEKVLKSNGLTIFRKVDHREGAASVDMELPPATVLIFGNPKLGTPLMQCAPTAAIDLPQKMLIWEGADGKVRIGYNSTDYLKRRHRIRGCDQELQKIAGALEKFARTATGMN